MLETQLFFPVAGIETWWWLPLLAGFVVAGVCSLAGLSGAFLLLPFQISVLGFTGLGVSATNHFFNVIAIQGGVYHLWRQKRLLWPLALILIAGTLPGVCLGVWTRMYWLHSLRPFKVFVGLTLLLLALSLLLNTARTFAQSGRPISPSWNLSGQRFSRQGIAFTLNGREYGFGLWGFFILALLVGIVGGIYGIGGGAVITPFIMIFYGIPVHAIAAAALLSNLVTSALGVLFFVLIAHLGGLAAGPDWLLGFLFGAGGFGGIYLGARIQHLAPERWIRLLLLAVLFYTAVNYLLPAFSGG
jgi:uncharacterized membrane protein YfcA